MSKGIYIGVGGKARKVKKMYVGVNGVARKVTDGYTGVSGVARKFFKSGYEIIIVQDATLSSSIVTPDGNSLTISATGKSGNSGTAKLDVVVNGEFDGYTATFDCDQTRYNTSNGTIGFECLDANGSYQGRRLLLSSDGAKSYTIPTGTIRLRFAVWVSGAYTTSVTITNFKLNGKNFNLETGEY